MNVGRWMWTFFPVSRVMTSAPRSSLWPRISRKAISHAYRWIGGLVIVDVDGLSVINLRQNQLLLFHPLVSLFSTAVSL